MKHGVHPNKWTYANIERMRTQMRRMGAMWNWDREAITCDPDFYKWTQWFFLRLYHANLAYREKAPVDFCPNCNTTLAREQVWDGRCERCGTQVIKKDLEQAGSSASPCLRTTAGGTGAHRLARCAKVMQTNSGSAAARRWRSPSAPSRAIPSRSSPPGRIRCGARPLWCWRPNTRWWTR
ncbi:MAG: class I tRNA ligase family protein [Caldilineaceae bacterium]